MMTLSIQDKNLIWHPFTQEKTAPDNIVIVKASGCYLYDQYNQEYIDLISSWWVNLHGHGHPFIAQCIYQQATTLEHVLFAGFTHQPAISLCQELSRFLPDNSRFFFSDNGSTAVEVALKMSYQYWKNCGNLEKKTFLCFQGGYHGDTFGAMSVGSQSGFHHAFSDLLFHVFSIPYPDTWDDDDQVDRKEEMAMDALDTYLNLYGNTIAALIVEPLIQGASGMRICRPNFIKDVVERVRNHGILIIFDEVMTGFYRTGSWFAMDQLGIIPDFLCLSKGITGGFLPLALTVVRPFIYHAFLGNDFSTAFAHGHSYTANPLACRAALASLDVLQSSQCQDNIQSIHRMHKQGIQHLKSSCLTIEKTRIIGTIAAFDVINPERMSRLKQDFFAQGMLIRPLGNTIYLLPPYCITSKELACVYDTLADIMQT